MSSINRKIGGFIDIVTCKINHYVKPSKNVFHELRISLDFALVIGLDI